MNEFREHLCSAGMSAGESEVKSALLISLLERLNALRGRRAERTCAFYVPGRLEILGKHTDYAGGRSLVCAIERGISMVAAPRDDAQVKLFDAGRQSDACIPVRADVQAPRDDWSKYAATVIRRTARDFPFARSGADVVFASDLPRASGMSSSSALMIAVFFALAEANSLWQSDVYRKAIRSREDLAGYLAAIESGAEFASFSGEHGVGTFGGSEDHVAILCSRPGFLRQYSYCPVRLERDISIPLNHTLVIGVSGVKADKTGNAREAYNRISLAARRILEIWRRATGREDASLASALASSADAFRQLREILRDSSDPGFPPQFLSNRLEQFATESNEIVPAASDVLARGDLKCLGELVGRSQIMAETLLGNQVPETIELARSARALGAVAASAFGAGFGGSVWALVSADTAGKFLEAWAACYNKKFPERATASAFFVTGPGPGLLEFQA